MCANVQAWYDPEVTPGSAPLASSHLSDSEEARYDVRARGAEGVVRVLRDEHPCCVVNQIPDARAEHWRHVWQRSETTMALDTEQAEHRQLDHEQQIALYRQMLVIRRCEEQLAKSYQNGQIPGACHTYVGEEAIATGVCAHLRADDTVLSTHRGHGHALAKGVPPRQLIAELFGRVTGCSQGRGGSMHLFSPEVGLLGTSGIVGPSILMATGAGYTFKLLKTDRVSVAFFGDGAVNNGAFHEGINMASIWSLPVIFVCENNQYATEVPFAQATRNTQVAERGYVYGLPGVAVDGNDVLAVHAAAGEAVRRARAGAGPTLLECKTYRTRGHAEGMRDVGYRAKEEVDEWKAHRDPIALFGERLVAAGAASADELAVVEAEVNAVVADALQFAQNSPYPDPATATAHVYSEL
jgi:2-oxoisovalerate dehydrogenase E1 component